MGLFVLAVVASAQEPPVVQEQEPNGWKQKEKDLQVIKAGTTWAGALDGRKDVDRVVVECDAETLYSFVIHLPDDPKVQLRFMVDKRMYEHITVRGGGRRPLIDALRLPRGRSIIFLSNNRDRKTPYRLEMVLEKELGNRDAESNSKREWATSVEPGETVRGVCSRPRSDNDYFLLDLAKAGPYELLVTKKPIAADPAEHPRISINLRTPAGGRLYSYKVVRDRLGQRFFPVLPEGKVFVRIIQLGQYGDAYRWTLARHQPKLAEEEIAAARTAIAAGISYLKQQKPADAKRESSYHIAIESLAMMALCEGKDHKQRAQLVDECYVQWLAKRFQADETATWNGKPVRTPQPKIYQHAIATLALAEAAGAGNASARKLCEEGVKYLLAAQQTSKKCKAWNGPVQRTNTNYGGWRYEGKATDADLSVTGWCMIALLAADAAEVRLPGMRNAVKLGLDYVKACAVNQGFCYQRGKGGGNNIRNSIAGLLLKLCGARCVGYEYARHDVDQHLPAYSQVDDGEDYAWYYAYYATRLNYLRGGKAWETWRTAMLKQLADHRKPDGSWPCYEDEGRLGDRFGTAMGVMIARMCLNDVPKYLRAEAKGF